MSSSVELLVNVTPNETRIALLDTGVLKEVHIEREAKRGIVGNIYKGRVMRVLPGMQSAFVDIGLDKAAFLHASDIVSHTECVDECEKQQFVVKDISELVREGQDIVVQVVKDPLGTKGARLTTDITLPSRYLVFMPENSHVGVSQRIESEDERQRLKDLVSEYCDELGGYIVRTAAEGCSEEEIQQDAQFLKRLWRKVMERKGRYPSRSMLYGELALAQRVLRDFVGTPLDLIRIDSKLTHQDVKTFTEEFMPELTERVSLYTGSPPLFDLYGVEEAIGRALDKRVNLKSGGYLIIEQTEAMTTIDINTGAFVGHRNLEERLCAGAIERSAGLLSWLEWTADDSVGVDLPPGTAGVSWKCCVGLLPSRPVSCSEAPSVTVSAAAGVSMVQDILSWSDLPVEFAMCRSKYGSLSKPDVAGFPLHLLSF